MIDMCLQLCQSPFLFLSSTSTRRIFRKCNMYKMAMKMPPAAAESTDNGIYEYQESSLSITAEEIENVEVNDFEAPPENDFSEYMWMEHEEEFDKEVMQRLEEEALMEECIAYMSSENASFQNPADG
ncbi:hypothetical protein ABEB36_011124 [Hypothenemus hampei]|uniref:Uncharacterized protein n=1 Tax=Hypothenemus hampei TaxID=57062 RepID=A0ABD1EEU4_HYPHA